MIGAFGMRSRRSHLLIAKIAAPLVAFGVLPTVVVAVQAATAESATAAPFVAPSQVRDVNPDSVSSGNLFGGRNEAMAVNPVNPQIVLAAVEFGGVFRSNNGGANWF